MLKTYEEVFAFSAQITKNPGDNLSYKEITPSTLATAL